VLFFSFLPLLLPDGFHRIAKGDAEGIGGLLLGTSYN
jgi:hypothetical protein